MTTKRALLLLITIFACVSMVEAQSPTPSPSGERGGVRFTGKEARTQEGGSFSGYQPRSFGVAGQNARAQESRGFTCASD
jgi:hypothetical protein